MRAAIFIDGGYLLKQLQDAKINPDYTRLAEFLLAPLRRNSQLDLMRCYFYYCPPWMSEKPTEGELRRMAAHDRFMAEIQEGCDRWQVRLGKLEKRRDGDKEVFAQKRVDVQLSVDLVQHTAAGHIQHAVLVAGDSDFIPAIAAAKESGATLTLWCDRDRSVHKDLLTHADEVHYIRWRDFPSRPSAERPTDEAAGAINGASGPNGQGAPAVEGKKKSRRRRGGRNKHHLQPQPSVGEAAAAGPQPHEAGAHRIDGVVAAGGVSVPEGAFGERSSASDASVAAANATPAARTAGARSSASDASAASPPPAAGSETAADDAARHEHASDQPRQRGGGRGVSPAAAESSGTVHQIDEAMPVAGGRGRAPGRGRGTKAPAAKARASTDDGASAAAPATGEHAGGRGRSRQTPAKASSQAAAAVAEVQPAKRSASGRAPLVPTSEHHADEQPGDGIGNVRDDDEPSAGGKARRRRGGRGRRRKAAPAGAAE